MEEEKLAVAQWKFDFDIPRACIVEFGMLIKLLEYVVLIKCPSLLFWTNDLQFWHIILHIRQFQSVFEITGMRKILLLARWSKVQ